MLRSRIQQELKEIIIKKPKEFTVAPKQDSLNEWLVSLHGPESSCYEGGTFFLVVTFPPNYPYSPPVVR